METKDRPVIPLNEVPDTFYEDGRENVVIVGDLHAMDEKPAERLNYVREVVEDLNQALKDYNSDTILFNGDTGSADHIGTALEYLDADTVIFTTGDEDRKRDEERNYTGWANILDREASNHFETGIDYMLRGEHIRLDNEKDLPGHYPVHVQHFPKECPESNEETGFEADWFSGPEMHEMYTYAVSPTLKKVPMAAIHSHTHGYDARQVGLTGLISLGGLRDSYVTNSNLPENSLQAFSFGEDDFEVVHQGRESGKLQESQQFVKTKDGFKLVHSRGKDSLSTLQRYRKDQLPPKYLNELKKISENHD